MSEPTYGTIETSFRQKRDAGRKLLVPYVTGGYPGWEDAVRGAAAAGADAIEVGIPFSDPVMDGPTIQEASQAALEAGTTPQSVIDGIAKLDIEVPVLVMTYYNPVHLAGHTRFASMLAQAGIAGAIIPDLPLEEAGPWIDEASAANIETVLLAAPTGSDERIKAIADRTRGFIYGIGLLGVTGERTSLSATAGEIAGRLKKLTDRPVLIGLGVSDADQARSVCETADGVIVGSAVVRRLLSGEGPAGVESFVASLRAGLDT